MTIFTQAKWKISKGAKIVVYGKKNGTPYLTINDSWYLGVAKSIEESHFWHQRLGHINEKGLKVMQSNGKILDLKSMDIDMCENYILEKQKIVSFKRVDKTQKDKKL